MTASDRDRGMTVELRMNAIRDAMTGTIERLASSGSAG